jgi:CO/xanthine dehydrogenase FAD-binding subunit
MPLHELLMARSRGKLITNVRFSIPENLGYEQVARSPADWPLVCSAVASSKDHEDKITVVIGGFGAYPIRLMEIEKIWGETRDFEQVVSVAQDAYKNAEDKWASAEYRSEVVGVLVRRLLKEVQS